MNEALSPGEFAKALQRKRASDKRRRYLLIGGLGGLIVLGAVLAYLLLFSSVFAAREVVVTGVQRASTEDIAATAAVEMGTALLRQDTKAITARVESLAPVRSAEVVFQWPSTVEIRVTERQPLYQRVVDTGYDLLDEEAIVFAHSDQPFEAVVAAQVAGDDTRLLRDVATVARAMPAAVRSQTVMIHAETVDRISLELADGREVVWGSAEDSDLKAQVLTALVQVNATVYDVSAPQNPTTK